jgi:DNA (cytosine-5)-methyltransferase 1
MKILNLYCGIGGNRRLWGDEHEITAIEYLPEIAKIYQDHFPNDKVIITDAHKYLEENFDKFDFIWSSPPCPSHSHIRKELAVEQRKQNKAIFPDMKLYEEILFLQGYFKGKWCVENVVSWYEPLIKPQKLANHYFWTNFLIRPIKTQCREHHASIDNLEKRKGFDLKSYRGVDKRKALRNCVEPETGKLILEYAINPIETQQSLISPPLSHKDIQDEKSDNNCDDSLISSPIVCAKHWRCF